MIRIELAQCEQFETEQSLPSFFWRREGGRRGETTGYCFLSNRLWFLSFFLLLLVVKSFPSKNFLSLGQTSTTLHKKSYIRRHLLHIVACCLIVFNREAAKRMQHSVQHDTILLHARVQQSCMGRPNEHNIIQHPRKQKKYCIVQHLFKPRTNEYISYNIIQL